MPEGRPRVGGMIVRTPRDRTAACSHSASKSASASSTSGTSLDRVAYDSFGGIVTETNAAGGDRFKFAARELDAETGQYYNWARHLDPKAGRFDGQDPIGIKGGDLNLYRYVGNRLEESIDPTGLYEVTPPNSLTYDDRQQKLEKLAKQRLDLATKVYDDAQMKDIENMKKQSAAEKAACSRITKAYLEFAEKNKEVKDKDLKEYS